MRIAKLYDTVLTEALTYLDRDVDRIYDTHFKDVLDAFKQGRVNSSWEFRTLTETKAIKLSALISSGIIQDKRLIAISEQDDILFVFHSGDNSYYPIEKQVRLSINNEGIEHVLSHVEWDISRAGEVMSGADLVRFSNEFVPHKVKASINHELVHLLDDYRYNKQISGIFMDERGNTRHPSEIQDRSLQGKEDPYMTTYEINALMHNIYQFKRGNLAEYETLTFEEMLERMPGVHNVANRINRYGKYEEWKRELMTRMGRENLLGRGMRVSGVLRR